MRRLALGVVALAFLVPLNGRAQSSPIAVAILTQSPAQSTAAGAILVGAKMRIDETNASGGLLGRKIDLVVGDAKTGPAEAVQAAKELARERVQLIVGGLSSSQALEVSKISRELKFVYVEALARTAELTAGDRRHQYVFRVSGTSVGEGRAAAIFVVRQGIGKRVASVASETPLGKEATAAFLDEFRKLTRGAEIADQKWVATNATELAPIAASLQTAKPDFLFVALPANQFVAFARQAKPLFGLLGNRVIAVNYIGAPDVATRLRADFPLGIWANTPDQPDWDDGCTDSECSETRQPHADYVKRIRAYIKSQDYPPLAIQGYTGMDMLLAAVKKAGAVDPESVSKALPGLSTVTALGPLMIRGSDHEANRGEFFGRVIEDPTRNYIGVEKGALYVRP